VTKGFSGDQTRPVPQDGRSSLSYDGQSNRVTTAGFSYDAAGNQKEAGTGQVFIYDAAGRLAKVKQNNTTVVSYTYGATRERLVTQHGAENSTQKTYYVWEGGSVIAEYSGASSIPQWIKNYIYFGGRLLATEEPDGAGGELVQYHHSDRLGTRLITNNKDNNVSRQETLAFGTSWDEGSYGATSRRFTSYDRNTQTGLDYAVNRHYDPRQGRFTQVDPIGMAAATLTDPQSLNMYSYVGNDPINRVDPDGLFWGSLFRFLGGLFSSFRPDRINASFTYRSLPPISVSFSGNFQNTYIGFAGMEWQVKGQRDMEEYKRELTEEEWDQLGPIFELARKALTDSGCADFIKGESGHDPLTYLNQYISQRRYFYGGRPGDYATTYDWGLDSSWIGLRATFFRNTRLGRVDTILHELMHILQPWVDHPERFNSRAERDDYLYNKRWLDAYGRKHRGEIRSQAHFSRNIQQKCIAPLRRLLRSR
jgi:RHS repeat-associated protein